MEEFKNPFVPTAGAQPHELSGREAMIDNASIALKRIKAGRAHKSNIFVGLRGVGKTVLLNRVKRDAEEIGFKVAYVEAPDGGRLEEIIFPQLRSLILSLSALESGKEAGAKALHALRNFAAAFKITFGDITVGVERAPGVADSGDLQTDFQDLMLEIGQLAKAAKSGAALFIDELQYLNTEELSAVIVAMHRVSQENYPVTFFGAGLPQIAMLAGNAKSYAERLFDYLPIGALDRDAAGRALEGPLGEEGVEIEKSAIDMIYEATKGYPYFLQEWGYHAWNAAPTSPIMADVIPEASVRALGRLDNGFFRVRFDRLTPKEKEYARAMAALGGETQKTSDVAKILGVDAQTKGPLRAKMISKGMIYSPTYGEIAFTVPLFADFLKRRIPDFPTAS